MIAKNNQLLVEKYKNGYKPTGKEYENYIAYELKNLGYDARTTVASGDFGTDVILDINQYFRIIFQCKYYSSRIGNHAVQEVSAAKEYYNAKMCVVITNQDFTQAAISLAAVNNVILIDGYDIGDDILTVCTRLGLIPNKYVLENALRINDALSENAELLNYIKILTDYPEYSEDTTN